MQKESVNILLAMPPQADEDYILEGVRKDLVDAGVPVGRLDMRSSKVKQYLELFPDTDVVIVAEHQESGSYTPKELDAISICREELCLIPIIDEPKGGNYVKQLEAYGIYTAVFEDGHDYATISKLIQSGRSKREARAYYGIETPVAAAAGGYDAENAVRFLVGSGDDYAELEARLGLLSERLGSTRKMLDVLGMLPEKTFKLAARMEPYRELCRLLSEEQDNPAVSQEPGPPPVKEEPKETKKTRGKGKKQKTAVEHRQTIDIGIVATNVGVGCTYSALMMAHSLEARRHDRVAVVEFDNRDAHFENLCRAVMGIINVSGITKFTIHGVDYFFNTPYSRFVTQYKSLYDYVIYDFGCADNASIEKYYLGLHHKFVVADGADWRLGELEEFVYEVSRMDINHSFIYLFPLMNPKDMGNLARLVPDNIAVPLQYENNPYRPGRKTGVLFERLLAGTWRGSYSKRETGIEEKAGRTSAGPRYGVCVLLLVLFLGIVGGAAGIGFTSQRTYGAALEAVSEQIISLESELKASRQAKKQLENEIERLTIATYSPKELIPAGTVITADLVDEVTIRSSLTEAAFLQKEDIGQMMARVPLSGGMPIYLSDVEAKREIEVPEYEEGQEETEADDSMEHVE